MTPPDTLRNERTPETPWILAVIAKFILWVTRWKVVGVVPNVPRMIIVGAPHTTNWDGFLTLLTIYSTRTRVFWMVKTEVVRGPLAPILKALGAVPIDRNSSTHAVERAVEAMHSRERMILAIMPEGTRRFSEHWRTGFYSIAYKADVPMLVVGFDHGHRRMILNSPLVLPTGDIEADMEKIWAFYEGVTGRYPEQANTMQIRPSAVRRFKRSLEKEKEAAEEENTATTSE